MITIFDALIYCLANVRFKKPKRISFDSQTRNNNELVRCEKCKLKLFVANSIILIASRYNYMKTRELKATTKEQGSTIQGLEDKVARINELIYRQGETISNLVKEIAELKKEIALQSEINNNLQRKVAELEGRLLHHRGSI